MLHKHIDISRNDRKTRAFNKMDELNYHSNVHQYQIEAISAAKEIYDAKCTRMDYILSRIMKSFDGKSKTIQYTIADDINSQQIDDETNVFDLMQKYCAMIASVGDGHENNQFNVNDNTSQSQPQDPCDFCGTKFKGHTEQECRRKKSASDLAKQSQNPSKKNRKKCDHCGKSNHKSDDCWHKDKESKTPGGAPAEDPATEGSQQLALPAPVSTAKPTPGLTNLLKAMQNQQLNSQQ